MVCYESEETAEESSTPLELTDTVYIVSALNNESSAVDIVGQYKDSGTNVHLWSRHNGTSQQFQLLKHGDYYIIKNVNSGMVLDVDHGTSKDKTNVLQFKENGGINQDWSFEEAGNGYVYIKSRVGAYLDVDNGSSKDGTNIQIYHGNKTASQKFKLVSVNEKKYWFDVNGSLNGLAGGTLGVVATADVYIDGKRVADDVTDYYTQHPAGSKYEIKDIKTKSGYTYDGATGSLSGTLNGDVSVCLNFSTEKKKYYFDVNGLLDGKAADLDGYGTVDVYINGSLAANDVSDYYTQHPEGTKYEIKDIKAASGRSYDGVVRGSLSGTIKGDTEVCLKFSTAHTHSYTGSYYESAHPHREYQKCSCGATLYTGNTRKVDGCAQCHVHNYTGSFYESAHPHKEYQKCSCGEIRYTGNTRKVDGCAQCHVHNYTGSYYESAHPHKEYQKCSCGEIRYTGNTRTDANCTVCNPPESKTATTGFDFNNSIEGFVAVNCKVTAANEYLMVESTSKDPIIERFNVSIDADKYKYIEIRYSAEAGQNSMQVYFNAESSIIGLSEEKSKIAAYTGDGLNQFKTLTIDMSAVKDWRGNIRFFRLDPLLQKGTVYIDSIRFLENGNDNEAQTQSQTGNSVTLYYNANGGVEPPSPKTTGKNASFRISDEEPSRSGYTFLGWSDDPASPYADLLPGDYHKMNTDMTIYAVWQRSKTVIVLTIGSNAADVNGSKAMNDVAPLIVNDRTMLPARFVAENLGATVSWNDNEQCVTIRGNDGTVIIIYIGSTTAYVNGETRYLDSPAFLQNDRTYTPVRFICEALGATVGWDEATEQVTITK